MNSAKIDEAGILFLERAGTLREQYCPKTVIEGYHHALCRDRCPLLSIEESAYGAYIDISLCEGKHHLVPVDRFTDERRGK